MHDNLHTAHLDQPALKLVLSETRYATKRETLRSSLELEGLPACACSVASGEVVPVEYVEVREWS